MSQTKKRKPQGPTFRTALKRAAVAFGVKAEDLDRAMIIGQIAGLLSKYPALSGRLAHKGAAVLRLVDKSARLSRDLDSGDIKGQRVTVRDVIRALSTPEARKVVLSVRPNRPGQNSASFLLECRGLSGVPTITVTLSINWSEPFMLAPRMAEHTLPDGTSIKVPVMRAVESASEKVRAFLTRGSANDGYDMWWYWSSVLTRGDRLKLGGLISRKIASPACRLRQGDLLELFDDMRENAEREWESGTGLTITGPKPKWADVDGALTKFQGSRAAQAILIEAGDRAPPAGRVKFQPAGWPLLSAVRLHGTGGGDALERARQRAGRGGEHPDHACFRPAPSRSGAVRRTRAED